MPVHLHSDFQTFLFREEPDFPVIVSLAEKESEENAGSGNDSFLKGLVAPNPRLKTGIQPLHGVKITKCEMYPSTSLHTLSHQHTP